MTTQSNTGYKSISQQEAKKMMDTMTGYALIDVRPPDMYAQSHIPGAINIPNTTIGSTPPSELPNKQQTIFVYCMDGVKAKEASGKLAAMGYGNVYELGGFSTWPYDKT